MFREIRRKKKKISDAEAKALLKNARRGILAVNGDDGYPYAIPVNYYYDEENERIYFHGARVGHKVDALRASSKVCFTVIGDARVEELDWAPYVQSVVVFGRCYLMKDPKEAIARIKQFVMKYYPDEATADKAVDAEGKAAQMFEIEIEHLSGKEVQEK